MSKLTFEFPDEKSRDDFVSTFSCCIEQDAMTAMEANYKSFTFDYRHAFSTDPIIEVSYEEYDV